MTSLRHQLLRSGMSSVLLKTGGAVLAMASGVVLARVLGAEQFGVYSYVLALVSILSVPAQFGLPALVVRETARAELVGDWSRIWGLWRWATSIATIFSVVAALLALAIGVRSGLVPREYQSTLFWGIAFVPLAALSALRSAALTGLRHFVLGQIPELLVRPVVLLGIIGLSVVISSQTRMDASRAMMVHAIAAASAFAVGASLLSRQVGGKLETKPVYEHHRWLRATWYLAMVGSTQLINGYADILGLGVFRSPQEVGVYRAVVQTASFVTFGLSAVNLVVAPHFARLHAQGRYEQLQKLVGWAAAGTTAMAVPVVIGFLIAGPRLLVIMFGSDYAVGYGALVILLGGQLVNSALGSVAYLLNMTGHERDTAQGLMIAAILNVAGMLLLIPRFGMVGAAWASAIALTCWNVILWIRVRQRLGMESSALGWLLRARRR